MHHPDLSPAVLTGLAWYYLLAAMLNAAAAAYIAYMEMVSEGASRVGLAPRTRRLPEWLVVAVDLVSGPTTFFLGATLGFIAMLAYRRVLANGLVAWGLVNAFLLSFGLSMTDFDFRDIVTKPDNVPIVGLIVLVGFFTWLSL